MRLYYSLVSRDRALQNYAMNYRIVPKRNKNEHKPCERHDGKKLDFHPMFQYFLVVLLSSIGGLVSILQEFVDQIGKCWKCNSKSSAW